MNGLSPLHRLLYAGCDLSKFSADVTLHKADNGIYHGSTYCSRLHWYNTQTAVLMDPTKVIASKACPECVSEPLSKDPQWRDATELAFSVTADDARFLRSALNPKSTRNRPEDAVLTAERLDAIAAALPSWVTGAAATLRSDLVARIAARNRVLRAGLDSPEAREQTLRRARAILSSDSRYKREPLPRELIMLLTPHGHGDYTIDSMRRQWSNLVSDGKAPHVAAGTVVEHLVTKQVSLSTVSQLPLEPDEPYLPGQDFTAWLTAAWAKAVRAEALVLLASWGQRFEALAREEDTSVVRIPLGRESAEEEYARARLDLINAFGAGRTSDGSVFGVVPSSMVTFLDLRTNSSREQVRSVDGTGVTPAVLETITSLWEPNANLEELVETAKALV